MNRADYERKICEELASAERVPFMPVSLGDWVPVASHCHENVDHWVREVPGYIAVRGWVLYKECIFDGEIGTELTAHSVVRDGGGSLHDITPLSDERIRPFMRFVAHVGDEGLFWEFERGNRFICCRGFCEASESGR